MKLSLKTAAVCTLLLLLLAGCKTPAADTPAAGMEPIINEADTQDIFPASDFTPVTEASVDELTEAAEASVDKLTEASVDELAENTELSADETKASMRKLLETSILPVGSTMYVWGGGWNEEDTGSGIETVTIGLSPVWAAFAAGQTAGYNQQNTRYQIHDGLDCSGYIGWLVYNTFHTQNGENAMCARRLEWRLPFPLTDGGIISMPVTHRIISREISAA